MQEIARGIKIGKLEEEQLVREQEDAALSSGSAVAQSGSVGSVQHRLNRKRRKISVSSGEIRRHVKYKRIAKNGRQSVQFAEDPSVAVSLPAEWLAAANRYAEHLLSGIEARHTSDAWKARLREKVYYQAKYAVEQARCSAMKEDKFPHGKVCEDRERRFDPADFLGSGLVQFAHFQRYAGARSDDARACDGAMLPAKIMGGGTPSEFYAWMKKVGQFRYVTCHKNESDHYRRNWKKTRSK